jgi:chromosome partitioning protein
MRSASEACGKRHENGTKRLLSSDRGAKPAVESGLSSRSKPAKPRKKRKKEGGTPTDAYARFLARRRPSIVEIFNGYVPPSQQTSSPTSLHPSMAVETLAESGSRSLQLIPSRFDFSDNLLGAVRPDPRVLARFLSENFKNKDFIIVDCAPTESVLTLAAYHATGNVLVPVKPEYFATIGFPLLQQSLNNFRNQNRSHTIDVRGVVINNAFYDGGNNGGPEKARALREIRQEAQKNEWPIYRNEIYFSRGYPKIMRGDYSYSGNAQYFPLFANEFFQSIGL